MLRMPGRERKETMESEEWFVKKRSTSVCGRYSLLGFRGISPRIFDTLNSILALPLAEPQALSNDRLNPSVILFFHAAIPFALLSVALPSSTAAPGGSRPINSTEARRVTSSVVIFVPGSAANIMVVSLSSKDMAWIIVGAQRITNRRSTTAYWRAMGRRMGST